MWLALLALAVLYVAVTLLLWWTQERMIFPRAHVRAPAYPLPEGNRRLDLTTTDGSRLVGNHVPARRPARALLLGFAGNAWNADDFTVFLAHRLDDVEIVVFHYRGYAPSEGEPGEAALVADALAIYDFVVARPRKVPVIVAGFSIGSGVAAALACARPVDGLVLFTPFDSILAIARSRFPLFAAGFLLRHPFRSDLRLAELDVPTAVVLASDDRIVPARHSRALVRLLRRPVLVETVPASTHGGMYRMPEVDGALRRAVDAVLEERRGSLREGPAAAQALAPEPR